MCGWMGINTDMNHSAGLRSRLYHQKLSLHAETFNGRSFDMDRQMDRWNLCAQDGWRQSFDLFFWSNMVDHLSLELSF